MSQKTITILLYGEGRKEGGEREIEDLKTATPLPKNKIKDITFIG
jgi:hypothetical protein